MLDSEVLDDGEGGTSAAAARIVFALAQDSIQMFIAEHLQDDKISSVSVEFTALADPLEFGAPDANGEASLLDSGEVIDRVEIELLGGESGEENLCPEHNMVAKLLQPDGEYDALLGDGDVLCVGGADKEMITLLNGMDTLYNKFSNKNFVYKSISQKVYEPIIKDIDSFYEREKNGIIAKYKEEKFDDELYMSKKVKRDEFLLLHKMWKGYAAMHGAFVDKGINPSTMQNYIVIPSILNSLLNPKINVVPLSDVSNNEPLEDKVTKSAIFGGIGKFFQYQHQFNSDDEFDNFKYEKQFDEIDWAPNIRSKINEVKNNFKEISENQFMKTKMMSWTDSKSLTDALILKIESHNSFIRDEMNNGRKCEDILDDLYDRVANSSVNNLNGKGGDKNGESILFRVSYIMKKTNLHNPCKENSLKHIESSDVAKGVKDLKAKTVKYLKDLNKDYKSKKNNEDYLSDLVAANYLAAVPVISANPEKATTVANNLLPHLLLADNIVMNKRTEDKMWEKRLQWWTKLMGILGIVAVVFWLFPPAWPFALGISSLAGISAVAIGAFLFVSYSSDTINENKEVSALEKAVFTGNSSEIREVAESIIDAKESMWQAITNGIAVSFVAAPAAKFVANPRLFKQQHLITKDGVKGMFRGFWGEKGIKYNPTTSKVWHGARHPVMTVKSATRKAWENGFGWKQGFGFKALGRGSANVGRGIADKWKLGFRQNAQDFRSAVANVWRNNRAAWKSTDDLKALKDMRKNILDGKGKIRISRDGKSGFIKANKDHLTPNREINISKMLKENGWTKVRSEDIGNNLRQIVATK